MRIIIMKLPSQKYRKTVAAQINDLAIWRSSWFNAESGSIESAQARVWYVEAKQRLALDLGIWLYSDDTEESLAAELADALSDLETCKWCEQVRTEAAEAAAADAERQAEREAAERAAEIEQAEAEYVQLRSEVLEAEGSSVNPADYTAIALWGEELGSNSFYIEAEQIRASRDGAPLSAIYKKDTGRWVTVHEMKNESLKAQLLAALEEAA